MLNQSLKLKGGLCWPATLLVGLFVLAGSPSVLSFAPLSVIRRFSTRSEMSTTTPPHLQPHHPFCDLPGDPSLLLTTNVDLGDQKLPIMKACSKAIAKHTGKPESYVGT